MPTPDHAQPELLAAGNALTLDPAELGNAAESAYAFDLDRLIDEKLQDLARTLTSSLLDIGATLDELHRTQGYKALGYPTWEKYLHSKIRYGRTYLSYLFKLGRSGLTLEGLAPDMGGSHLVEYAKHTDFPEKIPDLIAATWEDASELSVRNLGKALKDYVADRHEEFKRVPPNRMVARTSRRSVRKKLEKQWSSLATHERTAFLEDVESFLADVRRESK